MAQKSNNWDPEQQAVSPVPQGDDEERETADDEEDFDEDEDFEDPDEADEDDVEEE